MEIRIDPLTGRQVAVVSDRQARPNLPSADCPFCVGGLEAPEQYVVRAFANRWPTFPAERCEVVLYSPDHEATFASLGARGVRRVIDLWAERTAALGARDDVDYVLVFENRGAEVGATISHPHGQIFAYADVPDVPALELSRAASHGCPLCAEDPADRLVTAVGGWRAWVPVASAWPYGLVVAPEVHLADLPALGEQARGGLAEILVDVLERLDRLFESPMPYMLWLHQRPTDGGNWPEAHLHAEISPLWRALGVSRFVAGAELGSGMLINPVAPEAAAAALRDA